MAGISLLELGMREKRKADALLDCSLALHSQQMPVSRAGSLPY